MILGEFLFLVKYSLQKISEKCSLKIHPINSIENIIGLYILFTSFMANIYIQTTYSGVFFICFVLSFSVSFNVTFLPLFAPCTINSKASKNPLKPTNVYIYYEKKMTSESC